jgi:membrane protein DedA with SNARE-associated domain
MIIGIKQYPVLRYMVINLLACFIWAFVVVSVGLQVSHWLHQFWQGLVQNDESSELIVGAVVICILFGRFLLPIISKSKIKK